MNQLLKHRGYYGSIEASPEDNCLFGKVLYIQALLSYEGATVQALDQAFREAVEEYLEACAASGQAPERPCKGSFNVRVGHELHLAAAHRATTDGISLNELVRAALEAYLKQRRAA